MSAAIPFIVAALCLPFVALTIGAMFAPRRISEAMSIEPGGAQGLNTVRGALGGLFLACVSLIVLGLATGETTWLLAVAVVMGAIIVGRVVGVVLDGFDKAVVPPLVIELVVGGALVAAHVVLQAEPAAVALVP